MFKQNFTRLINIVFLIICSIHLIAIFYNNLNAAIPQIILRNKKIMDVNMPLSFIFCLSNTNSEFEDKKYQIAGYDSIYRFFSGTSMFNESIVGWHGHMENGSSLTGNRSK